jgi:hypothetical protein
MPSKKESHLPKSSSDLPVARPVRSKTSVGLGAMGSFPSVDLQGCEPNVHAVMARCRLAATSAGWSQQRIGDFRGKLFTIASNYGYKAGMEYVATQFKTAP